ncbi:hypothetical protein NN561_007183 [Cricetulus griseus]
MPFIAKEGRLTYQSAGTVENYPEQSHAREPRLWARGARAANCAWGRSGVEPRGPGQPEKELEPGRDEKVTPPGGATRFVGKMLAYCVQDATVVDVEKRRSPSKHYVSYTGPDYRSGQQQQINRSHFRGEFTRGDLQGGRWFIRRRLA